MTFPMNDMDTTQYGMPPMAESTKTVCPAKKTSYKGSGKVIALGSVGVVAGIAGAAGISAYTRAPGMNEQDVIYPSVGNQASASSPDSEPTASRSVAGMASAPMSGTNSASSSETTDSNVYGASEPAAPEISHDMAENVASTADTITVPSSLDEIQVAFSPDDSMSFSQAFSTARCEVGAHGIFAWRGGLYGTYYSDEWAELPKEYRTEFSNHDWTDHGDVAFYTEEAPAFTAPSVEYDEDNRALIALIEAVNGEEIVYYPDSTVTPVLDSRGQVIAMVENGVVSSAGDQAIVIDQNGDVYLTDDYRSVMLDELVGDYAEAPALAEEYFDAEDGVVTILSADGEDGEDVYVASVVDDDAVVIDLGDDDYGMAEVVDDDNVEVVTEAEDAVNTFPDTLDIIDDVADDDNMFNDYSI